MDNPLQPNKEQEPRPGAMAYKGTDGIWHYANPHDALYSTVTMMATHYYDKGWKRIHVE